MGLDIRLPLGLLFVLLGVILTVFGIASDPTRYQQSLGVNINLYWGVVLLVFGLVMLLLGRRGTRREQAAEDPGTLEVAKTAPHSSQTQT